MSATTDTVRGTYGDCVDSINEFILRPDEITEQNRLKRIRMAVVSLTAATGKIPESNDTNSREYRYWRALAKLAAELEVL